MKRIAWLLMLFALIVFAGASSFPTGVNGSEPKSIEDGPPTIDDCAIFPTDNIWNTRVDDLPVHPQSDAYVATIGATDHVHADFGSGLWDGGPIGISFVTVDGEQPGVSVNFDYDDESDAGPYPIPADAPIEGGPESDGDRHVLVLERDNCVLYELFYAFPQSDGSWTAGSGAIFDLNEHKLRPDGWTSADAAGLPILPGLVRYDEVAAGEITHALRFTAPQTQRAYVWPARHYASSITDEAYPPMGQRFRLKAEYDISGFSPEVQIILRGLKSYGMILADNGSPWYLSGVPDERWDNDMLHELHGIEGSAFEAVDVSSLMAGADSGQVHTSDSGPLEPMLFLPLGFRRHGERERQDGAVSIWMNSTSLEQIPARASALSFYCPFPECIDRTTTTRCVQIYCPPDLPDSPLRHIIRIGCGEVA